MQNNARQRVIYTFTCSRGYAGDRRQLLAYFALCCIVSVSHYCYTLIHCLLSSNFFNLTHIKKNRQNGLLRSPISRFFLTRQCQTNSYEDNKLPDLSFVVPTSSFKFNHIIVSSFYYIAFRYTSKTKSAVLCTSTKLEFNTEIILF